MCCTHDWLPHVVTCALRRVPPRVPPPPASSRSGRTHARSRRPRPSRRVNGRRLMGSSAAARWRRVAASEASGASAFLGAYARTRMYLRRFQGHSALQRSCPCPPAAQQFGQSRWAPPGTWWGGGGERNSKVTTPNARPWWQSRKITFSSRFRRPSVLRATSPRQVVRIRHAALPPLPVDASPPQHVRRRRALVGLLPGRTRTHFRATCSARFYQSHRPAPYLPPPTCAAPSGQ